MVLRTGRWVELKENRVAEVAGSSPVVPAILNHRPNAATARSLRAILRPRRPVNAKGPLWEVRAAGSKEESAVSAPYRCPGQGSGES